MEFGLRVKAHVENGIVAFPSLAVWHEPFYAKKPVWDLYYSNRNHFITNSIHQSLKYYNILKQVTTGIIYNLLLFDYNSAQMHIKAFEDYMQGPGFIINNEPETLHFQICEYSKTHKSQTIVANSILDNQDYQITKTSKLQKLVTLLTLNGNLLPQFLISNESAIVRYGLQEEARDSICKGFAKKRIIFINDENPRSYQNELDNQAAINILSNWIKSAIKSSFRWSKVNAEWKGAAKDLSSMQFWQDYLEPQK